ncbi:hypothetical protein J437_LFUL003929 [Ladona fulva]|uniref:Large ribosomal subunit protein mL40 n=1 Tax=Ladona fulva TaxID=123851 RepID=A0A8K0K9P6_LADFU|nr:hypothetical protein J437_LFUL003929 [Ladona fulva]
MVGPSFLSAAFSRISLVAPCINSTRGITLYSNPLLFKTTAYLNAEPLKKKKRIDPQILKQREERKKRRLEKQIRRLEKNARQFKPIDELEVPLKLIDERELRTRNLSPISPEEEERRALLFKAWARYKREQRLEEIQMIDRVIFCQQKAMDELRKESEDLYQKAIQLDTELIPFEATGPMRTPPIKAYEGPDGEYIDVSKKW